MKEESVRVGYIDALRVIAMLAVILNHSFGYYCCDKWESM